MFVGGLGHGASLCVWVIDSLARGSNSAWLRSSGEEPGGEPRKTAAPRRRRALPAVRQPKETGPNRRRGSPVAPFSPAIAQQWGYSCSSPPPSLEWPFSEGNDRGGHHADRIGPASTSASRPTDRHVGSAAELLVLQKTKTRNSLGRPSAPKRLGGHLGNSRPKKTPLNEFPSHFREHPSFVLEVEVAAVADQHDVPHRIHVLQALRLIVKEHQNPFPRNHLGFGF